MKALHATYRVKSEAGNPEGEILIYDSIGQETDWWSGDKTGISSIQFISDFRALEAKHDVIRIRINSIGGYVDEGLAIFNALAYSKKDVHVHVEAAAYSMAATLVQAAKKGNRHMKKATMMMIHSVAGSAWGVGRLTASKAEQIAQELRKYDELLASAMVSSTGKTQAEILAKWFDGKDHYLTPDEAKAEGLIDVVEDAIAAEAIGSDYKIEAFTKMRIAALAGNQNDEQGMLGKIKSYIDSALSKLQTSNSQTSQSSNMDLTKLAAKFATGDAVTISADESKAFKALLEQYKDAKFTQAEVDAAVTAKESALNTKITALTTEKNEVQAKLDKATGVTTTTTDADDIRTGAEAKSDPITAEAKALKGKKATVFNF